MTESGSESTAAAGSAAGTKRWFFRNLPANEVLSFLNGSPAQGAGEFSATTRPDGTVDLYYFSVVA